jgi:hypothetical protein
LVVNNTVAFAKAARLFDVPTILTTVLAERGGHPSQSAQDVFPEQKPIDRTLINTRPVERVVDFYRSTGVVAGGFCASTESTAK